MKYEPFEPDKSWEEVHNGEVIPLYPRPTVFHNWVAANIGFQFARYLKGKDDYEIGFGTALHLSEKDRFFPDVMVIRNRGNCKPQGIFGPPDLVVEVIAPQTALRDRGYKLKAYGASGVREYWIVDPVGESVEQYFRKDGALEIAAVHTLLPEDLREEDYTTTFQCSLYDDLTLDLEDIFSKMIPD